MSKRKSEEVERSRREKSMVALFVFTMATLEFLAEKKNCWTQKVQLAVTFSEIRLDCITLFWS